MRLFPVSWPEGFGEILIHLPRFRPERESTLNNPTRLRVGSSISLVRFAHRSDSKPDKANSRLAVLVSELTRFTPGLKAGILSLY